MLDGARRTLWNVYVVRLGRECVRYMMKVHKDNWMLAPRRNGHGVVNELGRDRASLAKVMYYASFSSWFEHPAPASKFHEVPKETSFAGQRWSAKLFYSARP